MPQFVISFANNPSLVEAQNQLRRAVPALPFRDPAEFKLILLEWAGEGQIEPPNVVLPRFGLSTWNWSETYLKQMGLGLRASRTLTYLQGDLFFKAQAAGLRVTANSYPGTWRAFIALTNPSEAFDQAQSQYNQVSQGGAIDEVLAFEVTQVDLLDDNGAILQSWPLLDTVAVQEFQQHSQPVQWNMVGEFRGKAPEIPLDDAALAAIKAKDADPFFMVLPIGEIGVTSHNRQRPYTRREVEMVVEAVNGGRVTGYDAHIPDHERGEDAPLQWLKAHFEEDRAKAWGKVYVTPQAVELREAFKTAMRENRTANPSIWGDAWESTTGEWAALDLRGIDVSLTRESSVPTLATVPVIVSELMEGEAAVSEDLLKQQIAELTSAKTALETQAATLTAIAELVGTEADGAKIRVQELLDTEAKYKTLVAESRKQRVVEVVAEVAGQPLADFVPSLVAELAITPDETEEAIQARATALLTSERWQKMTKAFVAEMVGGNVVTGGQGDPNKTPKMTDEEAQRLGSRYVPRMN
jgi:hypothetical protein